MDRTIRALLVATVVIAATSVIACADTVDPAQALAQKFSEASEEKRPSATAQRPAAPGADYEADMLERARTEANERARLEAQQLLATPAIVPAQPAPAAVLPPPPASAPPAAQAAKAAKAAITPTAPTTPESTQAAISLPAQPPPATPKVAALPPPRPTVSAASTEIPARPSAATATVLLVLDPEGSQAGFKPDPIICIDNRCWLSNGISAPALAMPRNKAVALPTTKDVTSDSCSGKSGCVYRGVAVDPTLRIDVIEVGEGGGASAGAYTISADGSCRKDGSSLVCDNGLATQNFRIWVVPETTAEQAGTSGLENAVAEGLPDPDVPSSQNDK